MNISIEKLIEIIVSNVITELTKQGVEIDYSGLTSKANSDCSCKKHNESADNRFVMDMSEYKTPVLTERNLSALDNSITEIVIPKGTIITPVAREIIKKRKLILSSNYKTN